jgi:hypothetical protein
MCYVRNERKSSVLCYRVYSVSTETLCYTKEKVYETNFASLWETAALCVGLERNTAESRESRESRWICPGCNLMAVIFKCHEQPSSDMEEPLISRVQPTQAIRYLMLNN